MNKINRLQQFIFLLLTFAATCLQAGYTLIEDQMDEPIKTPSLKDVKRVKMRLDNGIEALIISDPETPKSGAALSVGVGSMHEPFHQVGLAHFVEHMLFMGTEQYPVEKEYHEFIQENGGTSNAYTASNQTVYMYQINNDQMPEAISRFASFFDQPLFNASGLSRERQAVDHEFSYRANIDGVRQYLVFLEMTKKNHPLHTWRCGTKETLSQISRDELVEWHAANYGSNKMKLAVYTAQPIEEVIEQIDLAFSPVMPNKENTSTFEAPMMDPDHLGTITFLEPIQDLKSLTIQWEVSPEYAIDLDFHTMDLISLALSEEHPTSLATFLKKEGLIQNLSVGGYSIEDNVGFFQINMELSERGVHHIPQIIGHSFEAIQGLKKSGIPRYRFDEMVNMSKTNYHYQSRPNVFEYISNAAAQMRYEPLETFPKQHAWPDQFSAQKNFDFLESLKADQAIYIVMAPNSFLNKNLDKKEKLTGAKYCVEAIPKKQLKAWNKSSINPLIGMAPPNPYIPNDLNLVTNKTDHGLNEAPKVLAQTENLMVYYNSDSFYQVPEIYYTVYFNSPELNTNPQSLVNTDVYTLALADALSGLADQGTVAGINFAISSDPNLGLSLTVQGYSEKSDLYLQEIVAELKNYVATEDQFKRYKQKLTSFYENQSQKQQPFAQASEVAKSIVFQNYTSYEQKLKAIKEMDYTSYTSFCTHLFDQVYIRALLYGNLNEEAALELSNFLTQSFAQSKPYPLDQQSRRAVLEFDKNASPSYVTKRTTMEGNAALLMIGQGKMDLKKMAALNVFAKSVDSPFFDTLRTKQQTGYYVKSYSQEIERQLFSFFMVFSNSHAPRDLLARFELFNEDFLKTLNTEHYNQSKFTAIKESIISDYQKPKRSLAENGSYLRSYAFDYEGDFNFRQKQIDALNSLTFEEFLAYSYTYFGRNNRGRIAALVEGSIAPENALDYTPIQNISNFKSQLFYTSADGLNKVLSEEDHEL